MVCNFHTVFILHDIENNVYMINISLLKLCQPMSFYTYKYYTDIKIGVTFLHVYFLCTLNFPSIKRMC